jgi:hypothetical protein
MRALLAVPVLLLGLGCQTASKALNLCNDPACPAPCANAGPPRPSCEPAPTCLPPANPCPPRVEFKAPEEVHIKAPAPKVVIESAQSAPAVCAPAPVAAAPAAVPTVAAAPQMAYVPVQTGVAQVVQQAAPQASMMASTVQTTSAPRARLALGLDWIRIPMPIPRFFAIAGPQEVTTETQYFTAPQAQVAVPSAVTTAVQQVALPAAVTTAVPQAQVAAPMVAVQQAPPPTQLMAVQQAPPAQIMAVQPAPTAAVLAVPQAAPCRPPVTKEALEQLANELQKLQNSLNTQTTPQGQKQDCPK